MIKTLYICELCNEEFSDFHEALNHEADHVRPEFQSPISGSQTHSGLPHLSYLFKVSIPYKRVTNTLVFRS